MPARAALRAAEAADSLVAFPAGRRTEARAFTSLLAGSIFLTWSTMRAAGGRAVVDAGFATILVRSSAEGRAHGGSPGDLYVIIRTEGHPIFRRDGDDIYLTVPVSATEAALGAKIEVPTIDGRALLKIPPGTQSGQKLRLREKGVPSATKDGARGDEIVEITVTVPMPRDERTKELLRELAKLNPEDPRAELFKNL